MPNDGWQYVHLDKFGKIIDQFGAIRKNGKFPINSCLNSFGVLLKYF